MGSETALNRRITGDLDADRQRKGKKCYSKKSILLSEDNLFHSGEGNTAGSEDLIFFEISTVWTMDTGNKSPFLPSSSSIDCEMRSLH